MMVGGNQPFIGHEETGTIRFKRNNGVRIDGKLHQSFFFGIVGKVNASAVRDTQFIIALILDQDHTASALFVDGLFALVAGTEKNAGQQP